VVPTVFLGITALFYLAHAHPPTPRPAQPELSTTFASPPPSLSRPRMTLLERSQFVMQGPDKDSFPDYQWLSDHENVLTIPKHNAGQLVVEIYDTKTKNRHRLRGINLHLNYFESVEISPDKRWLLEHDRCGTNIMRLDGSHFRHADDNGRGNEVQWLAD